LALWKIINEEDVVFIPTIEARTFAADIWGRVSHYAATPFVVALFPGIVI
jgi:hypothetical protein